MASVINRFNLFFRNLYLDYYEVFKEVRSSARSRPLRASLYGVSTLFILNLFRTNEGLRSYSSEIVSACNRIGSVAESSRNQKSTKFVHGLGELNCKGLLRQLDLGFSTVIFRADCNPDVALYRLNCSYLKPTLKEYIKDRFIDLGFLGHWMMLEMKMQDYDVNDNDYEQQ